MGIPVPPEPFEIDPAKTYDVTVDYWNPFPFPAQCGIYYVGRATCRKTGAQIIAWIDAGNECTFNELCTPALGGYSERIFSIAEV